MGIPWWPCRGDLDPHRFSWTAGPSRSLPMDWGWRSRSWPEDRAAEWSPRGGGGGAWWPPPFGGGQGDRRSVDGVDRGVGGIGRLHGDGDSGGPRGARFALEDEGGGCRRRRGCRWPPWCPSFGRWPIPSPTSKAPPPTRRSACNANDASWTQVWSGDEA